MANAWYVIVVKEHGYRVAVDSLLEANVPIYIPMIWEQVREGRSFRAEPRVRYDGYIFALFDLDKGEDVTVRRCAGVDGILPLGQTPVPIRMDGKGADGKPIDKDGRLWVASMQAHELRQWNAAQVKPEPRKDIRIGDHVVIDKAASPTYGEHGEVMDLRRYQAKVLIGLRMCWIELIHLRKSGEEDRKEKAA